MSNKAKRLLALTAICLAAVLAPGTVAYALWSTTATGTLAVTTASAIVAPPLGPIGCTGKNAPAVTLTWSAPSGGTPTKYEVYEGTSVLKQVAPPTVTVSIPESALSAAGSHTLGVRSVTASGDTSTANPTIVIKKDNGGSGSGGKGVLPMINDPMRASQRFLTTALSVALLGAVVVAGLALVAVPKATGSRPLTVLTGSMSPTYPPGEVVIVKPIDADTVQIGDVITFQPKANDPEVITHRVVGVVLTSEGREYVTRGDANGADDPMPVRTKQIRGKVWYSVPYVGYVATWVSSGTMRTAVDIAALGLLVYGGYLIALGARDRRRRKPEVAT